MANTLAIRQRRGRGRGGTHGLSFVFVLVLAISALTFIWQSLVYDDVGHLVRACIFSAALDLATIVFLLRYVFRPEPMTADKLFGAAAAYLMLGSLWATLRGRYAWSSRSPAGSISRS